MSTHEFAFDLKLKGSFRVKAESFAAAVAILKDRFDAADTNLGAWPDGSPILGEVSLSEDPTPQDLYEVDGEDPVVCPGCEAIEGTEEWGTVGDGFDGYCPSCADEREESGEVEVG